MAKFLFDGGGHHVPEELYGDDDAGFALWMTKETILWLQDTWCMLFMIFVVIILIFFAL